MPRLQDAYKCKEILMCVCKIYEQSIRGKLLRLTTSQNSKYVFYIPVPTHPNSRTPSILFYIIICTVINKRSCTKNYFILIKIYCMRSYFCNYSLMASQTVLS